MNSSGIGLLVLQEKCWPRASLQCTTSEVLSHHFLPLMCMSDICKWKHVRLFGEGQTQNKTVFTSFQQCPATSSSSSLNSHWLFKLSLVNTKTQGECLSAALTMIHVSFSSSKFCFFVVVWCTDIFHLFVWLFLREWFLNGNYLIIIVSALIILPLALMRQLGMFFILLSSHFLFVVILHTLVYITYRLVVFTFMSCTEMKVSSLQKSVFSHKSFCNVSLSLQHRLFGLYEWLLPLLHGVFPHFGES